VSLIPGSAGILPAKGLSPAVSALSPRIIERSLSSEHPSMYVADRDSTQHATRNTGHAVAALIKYVANRDGARAQECLSAVSSKLDAATASVREDLKAQLRPVLDGLLARAADPPLVL